MDDGFASLRRENVRGADCEAMPFGGTFLVCRLQTWQWLQLLNEDSRVFVRRVRATGFSGLAIEATYFSISMLDQRNAETGFSADDVVLHLPANPRSCALSGTFIERVVVIFESYFSSFSTCRWPLSFPV